MDLRDLKQRPITADEYHAMAEAGIFRYDERLELIDGRLVVMEPIGWPHANCVARLTKLLARQGSYLVSPQNPLRLTDYTEPQPDLVLLREDRDPEGPMLGPHALLVIEVSDTSLTYDRKVKLKRYAAAGVPEVWIVDVNAKRIELYRRPEGDRYLDLDERSDGVLAVPAGEFVSISDVFPRP